MRGIKNLSTTFQKIMLTACGAFILPTNLNQKRQGNKRTYLKRRRNARNDKRTYAFLYQFPKCKKSKRCMQSSWFPTPPVKKKKVKKTEKQLNAAGEIQKITEKEIEVDEQTKTDVVNASDEQMHESMLVFSVNDVTSLYWYFLHKTYACAKEGKEEYDESEICLLGNDSPDFVLMAKGQRDLTTKVTCAELLQKAEKSKNPRELLMNCIDDEHLVKFMCKNPYFVKAFILKEEKGCK